MTTLYRFFDSDGTLLYIGISDRPLARLDKHGEDQPWWAHVVTARFEHFLTRREAQEAEWSAIRTEHPVFNVMGNGEPGRSERWEAWEAREQRRTIASVRAMRGEVDYRVEPYDIPCPDPNCGALDFEPCRTWKSRLVKERPHSTRSNVRAMSPEQRAEFEQSCATEDHKPRRRGGTHLG